MKTKSKILYYSRSQLFGIELVFIEFKNYQNLIESFLERAGVEFENSFKEINIDKEAKKAGIYENEYYQHLQNEFFETHREIYEGYPHNLRASFLIQIISFIEYELQEICNYHHLTYKTDFSISDLKGNNSNIDKAKKYLKNSCKINFAVLDPEWNFINKCKVIRNKIVHEGAVINAKDNSSLEVGNFMAKNNFIKYKENLNQNNFDEYISLAFIINNKNLNDELLKSSETFFKKLLEASPFLDI